MTEPAADVVIVGGGPAGASAALTLRRAGASVVLVDENHQLGGQYYRRREAAVRDRHGDYRPRGTALVEAVDAAGVDVRRQTSVWGVDDEPSTLLLSSAGQKSGQMAGQVERLRARAIVVATGAHERSLPFRGWHLPGVVTPGCALHLANVDRVPVGRRVVVGGSGPFLLPVACALVDVGVEVAAVVEANRPYRPSRTGLAAARYPARLRELAGYAARLARARVPVLQGWTVAEASGHDHVERVTIRHRRSTRTRVMDVDALAVASGFRPNTELALLLGVPSTLDAQTHDPVLQRTLEGRTAVPGVYVAGEVAGIAGAAAAELRGELVGAAVADDLGLGSAAPAQRIGTLRRRLAATERFAALTARLYPPPVAEAVAALDDDVQVCRCEGVSAGQIRAELSTGWNDASGVKGGSRAGMGSCQGRQCAVAVAQLAAASGRAPSSFSPRMPIKPVTVGSLSEPVVQE